MSMIYCGECGNRISDKAAACPQCGAPVQNISFTGNQSAAGTSHPNSFIQTQTNTTNDKNKNNDLKLISNIILAVLAVLSLIFFVFGLDLESDLSLFMYGVYAILLCIYAGLRFYTGASFLPHNKKNNK